MYGIHTFNGPDLRQIDLNLLVVLDTLMQERSVSKAAVQLQRTQSAISHALERLRQQLHDPLLVRQGGEMVPSPFALHLQSQLRPLLHQMAQALAPPQAFELGQSRRLFRVAMRDFLAGLFPDLLHLIHSQAPHVRLEWMAVPHAVFESLMSGALDLLIAPTPMQTPAGIASLNVGALQWACFMRERHPALTDWGATAWAQWPHIQVGVSDTSRNPVTDAAAHAGYSRQVAVSVPLFSAVAPALVSSDLIATLPRAVMRDQLRPWGIVERPSPFPIAPIAHALYWARRMDGDAGLTWFRTQVQTALQPLMDEA